MSKITERVREAFGKTRLHKVLSVKEREEFLIAYMDTSRIYSYSDTLLQWADMLPSTTLSGLFVWRYSEGDVSYWMKVYYRLEKEEEEGVDIRQCKGYNEL